MTSVRLTDEELLILDGHCQPETQAVVDAARRRVEARDKYPVSSELAGLIADIVNEAEQSGLLIYQARRLDYCPICKKSGGYVKYKSGINRGQPNYKRPLTFAGYEFADRFVRITGSVSVGACADCVEVIRPFIPEALRNVRAAVPDAIRADDAPRLVRRGRRQCPKCGWEGHEGEMGMLPSLMQGQYPGVCPSCKYESRLFSASFKHLDGFVIEEAVK